MSMTQPETTTQANADYFAKVGNAGSSTDLKIDILGELASFPSTYLAWGRVALHALIITATFAAIIMGATWPALLAGAGFTWMVNREGDE